MDYFKSKKKFEAEIKEYKPAIKKPIKRVEEAKKAKRSVNVGKGKKEERNS